MGCQQRLEMAQGRELHSGAREGAQAARRGASHLERAAHTEGEDAACKKEEGSSFGTALERGLGCSIRMLDRNRAMAQAH